MKISFALLLAFAVLPASLYRAAAQDSVANDVRSTSAGEPKSVTLTTPEAASLAPSASTAVVPGSGQGESPLSLQMKRRSEQDRAREAERRGIVMPYSVMLGRLQKLSPGDVVSVRLWERSEDRWIYQFRVLSPSGRFSDVSMDAKTARLINRYER
jgi:uncharacterized membrane protein YkoI